MGRKNTQKEIMCKICRESRMIKNCRYIKGSIKTCSKKCAKVYKSKQMKGRKITWGDKIGKTNSLVLKGHKQTEEQKQKNREAMNKRVADGIHNWYKHGRATQERKSDYQREWAKENIEKRRYYCRDYRAKKKINGGSHTENQWLALKEKYQNMCLCCKKQEPEIELTRDHVVPISMGGSNDIKNIQPLCLSCNSIKWATIIDYRELISS